MAFFIGQKVTMKYPYGWERVYTGTVKDVVPPKYGEVYVIDGFDQYLGDTFLILNGFDDMYLSERFRPVVEKKTDISVFTEMLNNKSKELCGND